MKHGLSWIFVDIALEIIYREMAKCGLNPLDYSKQSLRKAANQLVIDLMN